MACKFMQMQIEQADIRTDTIAETNFTKDHAKYESLFNYSIQSHAVKMFEQLTN